MAALKPSKILAQLSDGARAFVVSASGAPVLTISDYLKGNAGETPAKALKARLAELNSPTKGTMTALVERLLLAMGFGDTSGIHTTVQEEIGKFGEDADAMDEDADGAEESAPSKKASPTPETGGGEGKEGKEPERAGRDSDSVVVAGAGDVSPGVPAPPPTHQARLPGITEKDTSGQSAAEKVRVQKRKEDDEHAHQRTLDQQAAATFAAMQAGLAAQFAPLSDSLQAALKEIQGLRGVVLDGAAATARLSSDLEATKAALAAVGQRQAAPGSDVEVVGVRPAGGILSPYSPPATRAAVGNLGMFQYPAGTGPGPAVDGTEPAKKRRQYDRDDDELPESDLPLELPEVCVCACVCCLCGLSPPPLPPHFGMFCGCVACAASPVVFRLCVLPLCCVCVPNLCCVCSLGGYPAPPPSPLARGLACGGWPSPHAVASPDRTARWHSLAPLDL